MARYVISVTEGGGVGTGWDETLTGRGDRWSFPFPYDNKLYVGWVYDVHVYDIALDSWSTLPRNPDNGYTFAPIIVGNKLYAKSIVGTYKVYIYNLTTSSWESSIPVAEDTLSGIAVGTDIYRVKTGGVNYAITKFDTVTNTQTVVTLTPSDFNTGIATDGTCLYCVDGLGTLWKYDIAGDSWSLATSWLAGDAFNPVYVNGRVYLKGPTSAAEPIADLISAEIPDGEWVYESTKPSTRWFDLCYYDNNFYCRGNDSPYRPFKYNIGGGGGTTTTYKRQRR